MNAEALQTTDAPAPRTEPAVMLSSAQKAAIIITALEADAASDLLKQLGEKHVHAYVRATHSLKNIPLVVLEQIIIEFIETLDDGDLKLGPDSANEILSRIMSPDAVSSLIGDVTGVERSVWDRLNAVPDDEIAEFATRQHPRISAIILSKLTAEKAAEVIALFDVDTAESSIELLKGLSSVDPRVLEIIGEELRSQLLDKPANTASAPDQVVGAIFDNLTDRTRDPLMKRLEDKTPDFAKAVAKHMFLFDDIPERVEQRDIPVLTRSLDQDILQTAIAFARSRNSGAAEYICQNMSRRLAEQIEESIEESPDPTVPEGEKAEADLIKALRTQVAAGEITLKDKED